MPDDIDYSDPDIYPPRRRAVCTCRPWDAEPCPVCQAAMYPDDEDTDTETDAADAAGE